MTILDIISKELKEELGIEPLKEGEVKVFRLYNAGKVDPSSSKKTSTPQFQGLAPMDSIRDRHAKGGAQDKIIMNIIGYTPIKGKPGEPTYMDPEVDYIRFGSTGEIHVTHNDNNQYFYLKLHNKNGSNPNRKTSKPAKFYEVDEVRELTSKINTFDYKTLAAMVVYDASESQIFDYATKIVRMYQKKYTIDLAGDAKIIKQQVSHVIETEPADFIKAVREPKSYSRLLADDAVSRKLIFFEDHADRLTWTWKRTPGQKGKKTLTKLLTAENPVKELVAFLVSAEGNEDFQELKSTFEDYYKVPQ